MLRGSCHRVPCEMPAIQRGSHGIELTFSALQKSVCTHYCYISAVLPNDRLCMLAHSLSLELFQMSDNTNSNTKRAKDFEKNSNGGDARRGLTPGVDARRSCTGCRKRKSDAHSTTMVEERAD